MNCEVRHREYSQGYCIALCGAGWGADLLGLSLCEVWKRLITMLLCPPETNKKGRAGRGAESGGPGRRPAGWQRAGGCAGGPRALCTLRALPGWLKEMDYFTFPEIYFEQNFLQTVPLFGRRD